MVVQVGMRMSPPPPHDPDVLLDGLPDEPSDEQILAAVREGDIGDFALLWQRHVDAARRAAKAIEPATDPDDLVSEAFASILRVTKNGGGPRDVFRPYLFAVLRNTAVRWRRRGRTVSIEVLSERDLAPDVVDPIERMAEQSSVAAVFSTLSARHRTLLWYLEVEGMKPRDLAPLMGITPNAVSALAHRARESFRRAWLTAHIHDPSRPEECRWFCGRLVSQRDLPVSGDDERRFRDHLAECRGCQVVFAEIDTVTHRLRSILPVAVLGGAAADAYVRAPEQASAAIDPLLPHQGGPVSAHASASVPLSGVAVPAAAALVVAVAIVLVAGALNAPTTHTDGPSAPATRAQASDPVVQTDAVPTEATPPTDTVPTDSSRESDSEQMDIGTRPPTAVPPASSDHRAIQSVAPSPIPVDEPAPAPSPTPDPAPVPIHSPSPMPSPGSESGPPSADTPPAFRVTQTISQDAFVPPLIEGFGRPGVLISALDEAGVVLTTTTVGDDGSFSLDVSGDLLHHGMTVRVRVSDPESSETWNVVTMGPLTFAVPQSATTAGESGDGSERPADCAHLFAERGSWVEVVDLEGRSRMLRVPLAGGDGELVEVETGCSCVAARYVDPATGRAGITVLIGDVR